VLSAKDMTAFKSKNIGAIQYAKTLIESTFIAQVEKIISGKASIQEGIEHARNIMVNAQQAMKDT
jgi:hypothetical protein